MGKIKVAGMLACSLLVVGLLAGCGKGKQEAAVSLDEARLGISSARKAGADINAPKYLNDAETALAQAEQEFSSGNYGSTKVSVLRAIDAARAAEAQAKLKPIVKKGDKKTAKPPKKAAKRK